MASIFFIKQVVDAPGEGEGRVWRSPGTATLRLGGRTDQEQRGCGAAVKAG